MAVVIIADSLKEEVYRRFKAEAKTVFRLMLTLEEQPKRGKALGNIGNIIIKELKYGKFRFYFVTDGHRAHFHTAEELKDLLIKFVRMSGKNDQERTIEEIKSVLRSLGTEGFT